VVDCIRGFHVTGVQTCALPISAADRRDVRRPAGDRPARIGAPAGVRPLRTRRLLLTHAPAVTANRKGPMGTSMVTDSAYLPGLRPRPGTAVVASPFGPPHPAPCQRKDHGTQLARLGRSEEHTSELQSRENLVCR